jgi:hypothetical protein
MATQTAKKKIEWTKPADQNPEITMDDFKDMVQETEKGPFLSMTEFKQRMKLWRKANLKDIK